MTVKKPDPEPLGFVERIRILREKLGPMPDSTPLIRESRDHGWRAGTSLSKHLGSTPEG
jgi:hypothetical protein